MISYSVHLVKDFYNSYKVPASLAIKDVCVFLTTEKEKALEEFNKYKEIIDDQKEVMAEKEYKQYLYIIKSDTKNKFDYTIKKYGYDKSLINNSKYYFLGKSMK